MGIFKSLKTLNEKLSELKYHELRAGLIKSSILIVCFGVFYYIVEVYPNSDIISEKESQIKNLTKHDIRNITLYNILNNDNPTLDSLVINDLNSIDSIVSFVKRSEEYVMWKPSYLCCSMILTINLKNNKTLDFEITDACGKGTALLLLKNRESRERLLQYKNLNISEHINHLCRKVNHYHPSSY